MSQKTNLVIASIFFAVMWTAFMVWQTSTGIANTVILTICGAVAGVLWYFCMRKAMSVMTAKK